VLASGVLSGISGAFVMLAVTAIGAAWEGIAPEHPLRVIGETFVGPGALDGGAKVAFGAFVHLVTATAFGLLFVSIVPRDFRTASAIGAGVGFSLFALMFMMSLVVPWANPGFRSGMQVVGGSWVLAHAFFGVPLGLTPAFRRWLRRERSDARDQAAEASPRAARAT
jgi:hypothetical protein